ncbi:MAG: permease-like cell division protein FtsX, partial [Myxococcota bacterium]
MARSPGLTILAVGTVGTALAVLAIFAAIIQVVSSVADELGQDVEISAYIQRAAEFDMPRQADEVAGWDEVAGVRVLTSSQAMATFRESLGPDAVILDGLPEDVLPPSLEVQLARRQWAAEEVQAIATRLLALDAVEDVRYGQEDIQRLTTMLRVIRLAAAILGSALVLATVLIVSNTIRLTVYARRDEIAIMSLVGATRWFIRAPFLLEGALSGLLGGSVAMLILITLEEVLRAGLQEVLRFTFTAIAFD